MASASKTPNLNLPQWVGTEKPERTDFNAAFDAIDTTVASHLAESASKHIKESGSNANGRYIKFDDGTQICWNTVSFPATFTAWGSIFLFNYDTKITFPSAFISSPSLNATNSGGYAAMIARASRDATGITQLSLVRGTISDQTYVIDYVAIGRWKA